MSDGLLATTGGGFVASTPEAIFYVRLASLKGMVNLESKGLKSRAGPIRPKIATEFGLKPRDSYDKFIAAIVAKMETIISTQGRDQDDNIE
jgi:hypothetical protein